MKWNVNLEGRIGGERREMGDWDAHTPPQGGEISHVSAVLIRGPGAPQQGVKFITNGEA